MKTDEQLNDMTLVIVHKYCIIVNYYIVRYNMLYYCEVKTQKKCNSSTTMFVSKAEVIGFVFTKKAYIVKLFMKGEVSKRSEIRSTLFVYDP